MLAIRVSEICPLGVDTTDVPACAHPVSKFSLRGRGAGGDLHDNTLRVDEVVAALHGPPGEGRH